MGAGTLPARDGSSRPLKVHEGSRAQKGNFKLTIDFIRSEGWDVAEVKIYPGKIIPDDSDWHPTQEGYDIEFSLDLKKIRQRKNIAVKMLFWPPETDTTEEQTLETTVHLHL